MVWSFLQGQRCGRLATCPTERNQRYCRRGGGRRQRDGRRGGGDKKRAAGNPLSAGGSQGPLLLPKAEDTSNLGHDSGECKPPGGYCRGVLAGPKSGGVQRGSDGRSQPRNCCCSCSKDSGRRGMRKK